MFRLVFGGGVLFRGVGRELLLYTYVYAILLSSSMIQNVVNICFKY